MEFRIKFATFPRVGDDKSTYRAKGRSAETALTQIFLPPSDRIPLISYKKLFN